MAQQYRTLIEQQQYGYGVVEGRFLINEIEIIYFFFFLSSEKQKRNDLTIDEHFRKSLGDNYNSKYTGRCLTPDDSSSNGSSVIVDSIEEHFARSLAKFYPLNQDETTIDYQTTESVVDDHFAKALGSKTWGKLKEKS